MINKNIQDALTRAYSILKFTEAETVDALGDLAGIQQVAVATELVRVLNEDEIKTLNGLTEKSEAKRKEAMEQIAKSRATDPDFKSNAQAAAKKVLDEHIVFLKTRGDDNQKQAINKILAEIK